MTPERLFLIALSVIAFGVGFAVLVDAIRYRYIRREMNQNFPRFVDDITAEDARSRERREWIRNR